MGLQENMKRIIVMENEGPNNKRRFKTITSRGPEDELGDMTIFWLQRQKG